MNALFAYSFIDMDNNIPPLQGTTVLSPNTVEASINPDVYQSPHIFQESDRSKASLWEIEYYSHFFQVETSDVVERMRAAIIPTRSRFFDIIGDIPDLYGPFWIPTSTLFLMFAMGSLANFSEHLPRKNNSFETLSIAAFVLYTMLLLWPTMAWIAMKMWAPNDEQPNLYSSGQKITFVQWICVYGYAMTILIPYSISAVLVVLIFPLTFAIIMQWVLLIAAFIISSKSGIMKTFTRFIIGLFLTRNLWPFLGQLQYGRDQRAYFLALMGGLHALLFFLFKRWFF